MSRKILSMVLTVVIVICLAQNVFASITVDSDESITVYLSVCDNGDFVSSPVSSEKMAKIPVEISYFDLADYGLQEFYKYSLNEAEEQTVVQQPTLLHLFIQATEDYYLGESYNLLNEQHKTVFDVGGSAGSASINRFWNHDYNLVYNVDRANPETVDLPYATLDSIVLEDGDLITVGMFASSDWYLDGYFAYVDAQAEMVIEDASVSFKVNGRPVLATAQMIQF